MNLVMISSYVPDLLIFATTAFAVFGVASLLNPGSSVPQLQPTLRAKDSAPIRRGGSAWERLVVGKIKGRIGPVDEKTRTALRRRLLQAGYDSPHAAQVYYALRLALALACAALSLVAVPLLFAADAPMQQRELMSFASVLVAAAVGYLGPSIAVDRRRDTRQRQIRAGLPEVLDLLLVCTESGLGIDMAIAKVGEELGGPQPLLARELRQISSELRAGRPRDEAMRGFAQRTGVDEVGSLVTLLIQTDSLGTSMATTLRVFAADMRAHRLLRAEQMAQKVAVKLSFVLITTLLPAILISVMSPAVLSIGRTLRTLLQ